MPFIDPDPVKNRALFTPKPKKNKAARNTLREVGNIPPESSKEQTPNLNPDGPNMLRPQGIAQNLPLQKQGQMPSGLLASSPDLMNAVRGPAPQQVAAARPPEIQNVMSGSTAFLHDGGIVGHRHPGRRAPSDVSTSDGRGSVLPSLPGWWPNLLTPFPPQSSTTKPRPRSNWASETVASTNTGAGAYDLGEINVDGSNSNFWDELTGEYVANPPITRRNSTLPATPHFLNREKTPNLNPDGPNANKVTAVDAKRMQDALLKNVDDDIRELASTIGGVPMEALNNPDRRKAMADAVRKARDLAKDVDPTKLDATVTETFPEDADQVSALNVEDQLGMLQTHKILEQLAGRITNPQTGQDLGPTIGASLQGALAAQAQSGLDVATAREADAAAMNRLKVSEAAAMNRQTVSTLGSIDVARINAAGKSAGTWLGGNEAKAYLEIWKIGESRNPGAPEKAHEYVRRTNEVLADKWEKNAGLSRPDEVRPIFANTPEGHLNEVLWNINSGGQMKVAKETLMERLKTDGLSDNQLKEVSDALEAQEDGGVSATGGGVSATGQPVN